MKVLYKHINSFRILSVLLLMLVTGCIHESYNGPVQPLNENITIQLFTRANGYNIPTIRATANEDDLDQYPFIVVFKNTGGTTYEFVEAVKSFEILSKTFVILQRQLVACKIMVLANPQDKFYYGSTEYDFNESGLKIALTGKNFDEACANLNTKPLSTPAGTSINTIPFVGSRIPVSNVLDVTKIDDNTKIDDSGNPLLLIRPVAKIVVKNEATNFTLSGITEAYNFPRNGLLYNTADPLVATTDLINYIPSSGNIADAVSNTTVDNPLYVYESAIANNSYIIIKGTYLQKEYYYKMAFVNSLRERVDIKRNHSYRYNITSVTGEGHPTIEEARNAPAFNNSELNVTLTVTDESGYELSAFSNYYLAVSNSQYINFNRTGNLLVLKMVAYIESGSVSGSIEIPSDLTLVGSASFSTTAGAPYTRDLYITMDSGFTSGEIVIKLGNLKKIITVKRGDMSVINNDRIILTQGELGYYCVSGFVADQNSGIKLHPSIWNTGNPDRNDIYNIIVEDGEIKIEVPTAKTGTVYISTIMKPTGAFPDGTHRVKIDI